jgi:hypothetical protein
MADTQSSNSNTGSEVTSVDMVQQLLQQVKELTEKEALQRKENQDLKLANETYASRVAEHEATGKRKREGMLDGTIKNYFESLMKKYETELKPYESQLGEIMQNMKSNASSEPMIQALACAAASAEGSVTELEAQYQQNKKLKLQIDEMTKQLKTQERQMFSKPEERVLTVEASATPAQIPSNPPKVPDTFASVFQGSTKTRPQDLKASGMRERAPKLWNDLLKNAPTSVGMPKINDFMKSFKKSTTTNKSNMF